MERNNEAALWAALGERLRNEGKITTSFRTNDTVTWYRMDQNILYGVVMTPVLLMDDTVRAFWDEAVAKNKRLEVRCNANNQYEFYLSEDII